MISDLIQTSTTLTEISISWSPPTTPNGIITVYEIRYRESTSTGQYNITNTTNTQYDIVGLIPNTSYTIGVRAYTSVGPGEWINGTISHGQIVHTTGKKTYNYICYPHTIYTYCLLILIIAFYNAVFTLTPAVSTPSVTSAVIPILTTISGEPLVFFCHILSLLEFTTVIPRTSLISSMLSIATLSELIITSKSHEE